MWGRASFILLAGVTVLLLASGAIGQSVIAPEGTMTGDPNTDAKIMALATAIAKAEGFGVRDAIPTKANNPGDLAVGDLGHGTLGAEKISVFPSLAQGWARLYSIITGWVTGMSAIYSKADNFFSIGHKWVDGPNGPVTQDSVDWANNVARDLGVDPNNSLGDWLAS